MSVLVDSDILIEVTRGHDQDILSRWEKLSRSDNAILYSPVTSAELWGGARRNEFDLLDDLFRAMLCVPIDLETGRQAGHYLRQYRRSHGLALGDALIASAAALNKAHLWTRNRRHYPMTELSFY